MSSRPRSLVTGAAGFIESHQGKRLFNEALSLLERLLGMVARRRHIQSQHGDVRHTFADATLASRVLRYQPRVTLQEGLAQQIEWIMGKPSAPLISSERVVRD